MSVLDPLLEDGSFKRVPFLVCATSFPPFPYIPRSRLSCTSSDLFFLSSGLLFIFEKLAFFYNSLDYLYSNPCYFYLLILMAYLYILNTKVGYFLIPYKYINFKIKLRSFYIPSSIKQPLLQQMFLFDNIILLNLISKPPYVLY